MAEANGIEPSPLRTARGSSPLCTQYANFHKISNWRTAMDLHHTRYERAKHLAGVANP